MIDVVFLKLLRHTRVVVIASYIPVHVQVAGNFKLYVLLLQ
jgi:hypothetical protein